MVEEAKLQELKRQPVGVCETCGHRIFSPQMINERCSQDRGKLRCRGAYGSRLNTDDWTACQGCTGAGWTAGQACARCDGSGWVDNRR